MDGPIETMEDLTSTSSMQIDDNGNEHKQVKLSSIEGPPLSTTTLIVPDENLKETKSGETMLTPISLVITSPFVTIKTNKTESEATTIMGMKFSPDNLYIESKHENSHKAHLHMADLEMEVQRTSKASGNGSNQQTVIIEDMEIGTGNLSTEPDRMEIESNGTIENDKGTDATPTYNAVLKSVTALRAPNTRQNSDRPHSSCNAPSLKILSTPRGLLCNQLQVLPEHPDELPEQFSRLFPITERENLHNIPDYCMRLRQYYIFDRLPKTYFDIAAKNPQLPDTQQE
ncbi:hypothetical protein C2G38_2209005 [Gigaspora rosea]|uniref:Uncharacterized protein n=1 Tax=Gigaspora rosea TaxID=44941 RepID=A0A397UH13_9GLOM|nr:hypothetical protein C2G38_2209005 [Gigaspora rosea]